MKGVVILIGIAVLAFIVFLWTPDQADLEKHATRPVVPELDYAPLNIPRSFWPEPVIDRPEQLDCNVGDFLQDKSTDPDWNQCPMLI